VGSLFLVGGLLVIAAASIFHRLAVRPLAVDSARRRSRRRLHLLILSVGVASVAYGIWHLRNVPQGPNI
jgi:multisubunit Na+/H+ antiporter MnhB subunit